MTRHIEPNDEDLQAQIGTESKPWYKVIASLLFGDASGTTGVNSDVQTALNAKADLVGGVIPASQLPSYVDDVLEYLSLSNFPATGEAGKIYVATDTSLAYRWSGSTYIAISSSIALGETASTAYRGDRGKIAYDHSQATGNQHSMTKSDVGLGNCDNTADSAKPVSTAMQTALDAKEPTLTKGNLTESTSSVLTITGGTSAVIGAGAAIQVKKASASQDGYLAAEDYEQFSNASDLLSWVYDIDTNEWVIDADNLNPVVCLESSGA